jgi:tetratricopeptide (TPR) repeat protein
MKTTILVRALLICLALAASCAAAKSSVQPVLMLRLADEHRLQTEHTKAAEIYQQVTTLRPTWARPHVGLGQTYLAQGRWAEAGGEFSLAAEIDEQETGALSGLAEVAYHRGDVETAIGLWRRAVALDPSDSDARCWLSRAYVEASRFSLAEHQLHRILLQEADHQGAHHLLGVISAPDDPALAAEHLQVAALGPDLGVAQEAADLLGILGRFSTDTPESQVADQLARWYLRHEMPTLALVQLDRLLQLEPGNDTARAYEAYALFAMGRLDDAWALLRQVTHTAPDDPLGHYFLGLLHRSEGYLSAALWDFKRSLQLDPSNAAAYAEVAQTYASLGQYAAAEEWYRAATNVAPEEPGFWVLLAEFYVDVVPSPQPALNAAAEAVALDPDDPLALDLLGWAYSLAGDPSAGRVVLERSLALDPSLARAYYHLGVVRQALGDQAGAEWAYQRAIDVDTDGLYREKALRERSAGES